MKKRILIGLGVALMAILAYTVSQGPRVSVRDGQWSFVLTHGGYRAWHLDWCDGQVKIGDGPFRPIVFTNDWGDYSIGSYRTWPKFRHADSRKACP